MRTPAPTGDLRTPKSRLGPLAVELRNHLRTVILAVTAMKAGSVGTQGATASVLDHSLMEMHNLMDRLLAEA